MSCCEQRISLGGTWRQRPYGLPREQENEAGRIRLRAHVIAVEGDPLDNIRVMEDVRFVVRDGRVVKAP